MMRIAADCEVETLAEQKGKWIDHVAAHAASAVRVYAAGKDVTILDRKGKNPPRKLTHSATVGGLAINPKGKRLAVSHYGGVTLWWLAAQDSKSQLLEWKGSHLNTVWSPDGDYIITAMQENSLHGWRLADNQHMRMTGYGAKVRSMSFSRRGQLLATGGADTVICWPFMGGGPMGKPPVEMGGGPADYGAGTPVTAVACNPKRDIIAAAFANGAVTLCAPQIRSVGIIGPGKGPVTTLVWNASGDRLLIGDEAGDVMLGDFRN
jgi:WD40 repeat protein